MEGTSSPEMIYSAWNTHYHGYWIDRTFLYMDEREESALLTFAQGRQNSSERRGRNQCYIEHTSWIPSMSRLSFFWERSPNFFCRPSLQPVTAVGGIQATSLVPKNMIGNFFPVGSCPFSRLVLSFADIIWACKLIFFSSSRSFNFLHFM